MPYVVNHIHLKSEDPKATADWFVEAFKVKILSDTVRDVGDRFVVTQTEGGLNINISGARTGESMGPSDADAHWGLEHFGFDTDDMEADLARLESLGATIKEPARQTSPTSKIAFIAAPGGVRIELIERK